MFVFYIVSIFNSTILMLVFKDTITGLAAGVRLTSNDMLHKGDWITVKSCRP